MAKRTSLWVAGALLIAVGGTAVASNMGFKFVPNLASGNPAQYTISLPLNNNYTNAESIRTDINGSGCTASKLERIQPNGKRTTWVGTGTAAQNFSVTKGEGYVVVTTAACTTWVVVGSHDPTFPYNFPTANPAQYLTSIPYHTTAQTAEDIRQQIGSTNTAKIEKILTNGKRITWVGTGTASQNFPVTIGDAYIVVTSRPNVSWTPAHY